MEIHHYSQRDDQWRFQLLGFSDESTIGDFGCLITDVAMVARHFGYANTPDSVNTSMKRVHGFTGAYMIASKVPEAVPGLVYARHVECRTVPAPLTIVNDYLNQGVPVIVELDYSPSDGFQNHWVLLTERVGRDDYKMNDPWNISKVNKTLVEKYGFAGSAEEIITNIIVYTSTNEPAPIPEPEVPDEIEIYDAPRLVSVVDWVRVRTEPSTKRGNITIVTSLAPELVIQAHAEVRSGSDVWVALNSGHTLWSAKTYMYGNEKRTFLKETGS